jgi:hypothetical protein
MQAGVSVFANASESAEGMAGAGEEDTATVQTTTKIVIQLEFDNSVLENVACNVLTIKPCSECQASNLATAPSTQVYMFKKKYWVDMNMWSTIHISVTLYHEVTFSLEGNLFG